MLKHYSHQSGKQISATSTEEGIQYVRLLAVLESPYGDLDDNHVSKDADGHCT